MNVCQNCKTENEADSKFCKNCGNEIVIATTEVDIANNDALANSEANSSSKEVPKRNKLKDLFIFAKDKMKKFKFFRSKKNIITTSIVVVLVVGVGIIWNTGIVTNAIANSIYNDMNVSQITYDEAKNKLNILDKVGDVQWAYSKCDDLNNSQCSYRYAVELQNKKNYETAIFEYGKVIEEDLNYENARESIEECKSILSREAYTMAVAYEKSCDWAKAVENYSYVIESDENYTNAQAKIVELKKKLLDSTLSKLNEYKVSNDFEKALELIALTEKHVQNDDLNFYKEHFNTQKAIADVVKFDYNHGPFTLYKTYSSGGVMYTTYVETFNITSAERVRDGDLKLVCDITGITDWDFCSFKMKCYNSNEFLIDSVSIIASVSKNEAFKVTDEIYIPYDTVRVEFAAD